jgi:hypothetical protein
VSGILARIKALFEPSRPAAPPPEVREEVPEAPVPAAAVPEPAETTPLEPITAVEAPPAEEAPAAAAEQLSLTRDAPVAVAEAPAVMEEAPAEVELVPQTAAAGGLTLQLESERGPRATFEVTKSGATIGRGPESTIQLADISVSRKHAKITYKQGAYWLSDLGSMGGTWIDGAKLAAPRRVATGQTIDIGLCRLTVTSAGAEEESPAAKASPRAASGR